MIDENLSLRIERLKIQERKLAYQTAMEAFQMLPPIMAQEFLTEKVGECENQEFALTRKLEPIPAKHSPLL